MSVGPRLSPRNRGASKARPGGASHRTSGSALPTGGTRCVPPSALDCFCPAGRKRRHGLFTSGLSFPAAVYHNKKDATPYKVASLVGPAGFEPTDGGVKVLCLTAWRRPIMKKRPRSNVVLFAFECLFCVIFRAFVTYLVTQFACFRHINAKL